MRSAQDEAHSLLLNELPCCDSVFAVFRTLRVPFFSFLETYQFCCNSVRDIFLCFRSPILPLQTSKNKVLCTLSFFVDMMRACGDVL
jgi:hypothetical protein